MAKPTNSKFTPKFHSRNVTATVVAMSGNVVTVKFARNRNNPKPPHFPAGAAMRAVA